jgi:hypothetical protein
VEPPVTGAPPWPIDPPVPVAPPAPVIPPELDEPPVLWATSATYGTSGSDSCGKSGAPSRTAGSADASFVGASDPRLSNLVIITPSAPPPSCPGDRLLAQLLFLQQMPVDDAELPTQKYPEGHSVCPAQWIRPSSTLGENLHEASATAANTSKRY